MTTYVDDQKAFALFGSLTPYELDIVYSYAKKLVSTRSQRPECELTMHEPGDGCADCREFKSVSEKLQEELEPLPGVPRYTNVVIG